MKTNKQTANHNQNTNNNSNTNGLQNRSEQSSTGQTEQTGQGRNMKPYVNYAERDTNRALPTDKVLQKLRSDLPEQYNLAEVVGKWIWITFRTFPPTLSARASHSLGSTGTTSVSAGNTPAAT